MKRIYIILTALTLLVALVAGCRRVTTEPQPGDPIEGGREIGVAAGISFTPTLPLGKATPSTPEAGGVFEKGDSIGLYLKSSVTGYVAANSNVLYIATERQVPPEIEGGEATTVLEFTSDTPMKYYSYDKHDVTGYYPYRAAAPAFGAAKNLNFNVLADQTGAQTNDPKLTRYTLSDLMWTQKVNQRPQPKNSTEKIQMTFNHKLTNVIVVIKNQGDIAFVGAAPEVWIANTNRAAVLNLKDGTLAANTATPDKGTVKMERITASYESGVTTEIHYRAIAVPQTLVRGTYILNIVSGGVNYQVSATQEVQYQSGKQQKINVLNTGVDIRMSGCEVQDWGSVRDVDGGVIGGDGVNPCKLNFTVSGTNANAAAFVTHADLTISGKKYPSTSVSYNATTKVLTISYDQGSDWGVQLQGYELFNPTSMAAATELTWEILGDNSDLNYAKIVGTIAIEPSFNYTAQPANSYITYPGKSFTFDARKKAVSVNGAATNVVSGDVSSADMTPASVKVVWQTGVNHHGALGAQDMIIQGITYNSSTGICTVTPNGRGAGNALVAAYDGANGSGNILWSWHIWVTDGEVKADVNPGNEANGAGKNFMDRNLGALAATTAQPAAADAYKYFGLLWQWGRKEPFTGQGVGEVADTYTKIYKADATPYPAALGGFTFNDGAAATMADCIKNPITHYKASDNGLISGNPATWSETGNKSIYDPCPYGYRVPINGTWTEFPSTKWANGDIKGGSVWQSTWWPAMGYRNNSSAALSGVVDAAYYWSSSFSSSATDYRSYSLSFNYAGGVNPSTTTYRSNGLSVRCVQE